MKKQITTFSPDEAKIYLYLKKFLPNFLRLLDPTPRQLRLIGEKIEQRYFQVESALRNNNEFMAETTLIDLFWKYEEHDIHAIQFLNYIDKACSIILKKVSGNVVQELRSTLIQLIINFDERKSRYRSYIGELSVLSKLISDEDFELSKVEHKMPNGKSADYAFNSKKGLILVEVENIDLVADKIATVEDLDTFVTYRTEKKLTEKLDNLPSDWNHSFYLVQIIWGDILKLYDLRDYFTRRSAYDRIALKLMIVAQFFNKKLEIPKYIFLTAEEFLKLKHEREDP